MLGGGPHIEDLAKDVFLRAFRAFAAFDLDGTDKPSTRVALDVRKRRVVPIRPIDDGEDVGHGVTPETETARAELGRAIEQAANERW